MNSNAAHSRRIDAFGRILGHFVVAVGLVLAAQLVVSWFAPIVAIPLLVAGWVVGLGLALFLPFALVGCVTWVLAR